MAIDDETKALTVKYSGKLDGLTFEKFDDLVIRWEWDENDGAISMLLPFGKMK